MRFCDVKILEDHLDLFIASSKTDKLRNGNSVPIALSGNSTCPVGILQRYISATTEPSLSNNYLFRPINAKKQALREGKMSGLEKLLLDCLRMWLQMCLCFGSA